ncbi:GNAT family N-acetyltransferase [Actinomycetospora cinnamomea]|uniref:Ribosomal protein S18 acetylase RimI-like enzyme n=1 Tax=Actinomycetospora cinnamomea TaxID=663609 RepID=A0A2U1FQ38_9PSEU|nr:GNAT family N-acetyltransferase [Actinomycetospora cinnamomea]PVZ14288.1 ribosomal protein S18 acetylase RimI-like enzyme [Actinomycetospora cinnamomea]
MTAPLTIRVAEAADVDSLLALVHSAYRGPSGREGWTSEADLIDGPRTTRALLAADLADPSITMLVAGDLLGCAAVTHPEGSDTASFGMFAVRPGAQQGGIGTTLLRAAEEHALERGATTMEMCVIDRRTELIEWYERRGYTRTGETRPFPYGAEGVGEPRGDNFRFAVLEKDLRG